MEDYTTLVKTLRDLLTAVQPKIPYTSALLGDGNGAINVPNRPGYYYVRSVADSQVMQIFGIRINGYDGLPIIIGELPWMPGLIQIVDTDWRSLLDVTQSTGGWIPTQSYINAYPVAHGDMHHSMADDPIDIDKQNLREFRLDYGTGRWDVRVGGDFYTNSAGTLKYFAGGAFDLAPYATGSNHFISLYLNSASGTLAAINGTMITGALVWSNGDPTAYFPTVPAGSYALGTILYTNGATGVSFTNLYNDKLILKPSGAASVDIGARVYSTAAQTIQNNTDTAINFEAERWDTDTIHDTVTNNTRLTCKTAGKYVISGHGRLSGSINLKIKLNGTTYIAVGGSGDWGSISTIYSLAVNDYVELFVRQGTGGPVNMDTTQNYSAEFAMQKIG